MSQALLSLLAFTLAAGLMTLTPGLDTVMTLRTAAADGRRAGLGAVLGIALGISVWGVGAAFGLTALLRTSAIAFLAVKCAGAAYLIWLGLSLIIHPRTELTSSRPARKAGGAADPEEARIHDPFWHAFRRGLMTDLLNPKIGVFVITFFPQFIPPHVNTVVFSLLLAGILAFLSVVWLGTLVFLTAPLGRFLSRPVVVKRLDRLTGAVFIGFGAKLLLTHE
ncbi:LysE family translocator [Oecophyllibacter saccharovorans]|uniref:LysE family translocator n=1 Tax=Oecophyllibacter saccharovorans TaxID=2558360 RepID=A0A506UMI8_9PROT|nr:LysE family translocator [Oecophyllibacter saccharovorans]QDH15619.1 LysE family translocator [Oecophyllibacter saccharovorans]TPW34452.1 LysE family translocator [Oecophyllibacter saccharovorans]